MVWWAVVDDRVRGERVVVTVVFVLFVVESVPHPSLHPCHEVDNYRWRSCHDAQLNRQCTSGLDLCFIDLLIQFFLFRVCFINDLIKVSILHFTLGLLTDE